MRAATPGVVANPTQRGVNASQPRKGAHSVAHVEVVSIRHPHGSADATIDARADRQQRIGVRNQRRTEDHGVDGAEDRGRMAWPGHNDKDKGPDSGGSSRDRA
jgi:hypothetical protein